MNLIPNKEIKFYKKIKNADAYAYSNNKFLKNIKLMDGIEIIGEYTFYHCKNLKTVVLPDSIRKIEDYAFEFCTKLEEIVLPEELEYIGRDVFYDCQSLKKIIIPKNIKKILEKTFRGCKNLKEVILPEKLEYIGEDAFDGCEKLERIVIPKSVKQIDEDVFGVHSKNLEIYDQETNIRFINDINYNYDKDKSIDEIIKKLCFEYDIVKEKLLLLAKIRLWSNHYEKYKKLNYENEYNSLINYCKNNLFVSLEKHNLESQKNMDNNQEKKKIPWYAPYIPGFVIPVDAEYVTINNNVPSYISGLIDEETLLLEKLGIKKDKYGYWKDGDLIPELKAQEEIKTLRRTKNSSNPH